MNRLDMLYKSMVVIALTMVAMILASDLIIPLAFSALISVVMLPLVKKLEARKIPSAVAIALVLVISILALLGLTVLAVSQITALISDLPNLEGKLNSYYLNGRHILEEQFGISSTQMISYTDKLMGMAGSWLADSLLSLTNAITSFIQVPIYIFLFLIYRSKFKMFFDSLFPKSGNSKWQKDIQQVIMGYLSGLVMVILIIASLNTLGLLILGIEHAIFFGLLSGILTIIPYIGNLIGGSLAVLVALITRDSIWPAVGVVLVFGFIQFLEGNFITPRITASRISINALAAIVALFIGGMIWGISGMILSVPAVGILKIILGNIPQTRAFVILLEGDTDSAAEVAEPITEVQPVDTTPPAPPQS